MYTNALSISTAVLLAFLAQGQVAADTVEPASPAAPVENVLKAEEAGASPVTGSEVASPSSATEVASSPVEASPSSASPASAEASSSTASDTASPTTKV